MSNTPVHERRPSLLGDVIKDDVAGLWFARSIKRTKDVHAYQPLSPEEDSKLEEHLLASKLDTNHVPIPSEPQDLSNLRLELSMPQNKVKKQKIKKSVFISFKVKRLSAVANVDQTFRMKFHIYFNWLPTLEECKDYVKKKQKNELHDWTPRWYPHLEFVNAVEEHKREWEAYPSGGQFRIESFHDFGYSEIKTNKKNNENDSKDTKNNKHNKDSTDNKHTTDKIHKMDSLQSNSSKSSNNSNNSNNSTNNTFKRPKLGRKSSTSVNKLAEFDGFDCNETIFIRAKLECDITFSEVFELDNFPLDCQDLTCVIEERSKDIQCKFLPELRNPNFTSVEQKYSVISEWKLVNAILQLGQRTKGRTPQGHPKIELRLKIQRKWDVYVWRVIFFLFFFCVMDLTAYSLNFSDDLGDRLGLIVTLVLTIVAFSIVIEEQIPNVPYLTFLEKYILACYFLTTLTMMQSALVSEPDHDNGWFWFFFALFILIHIFFVIYGIDRRIYEKRKLHMTGKELEELIERADPKLNLKYDTTIYQEWKLPSLEYRALPHIEINAAEEIRESLPKFMVPAWMWCERHCLCTRHSSASTDTNESGSETGDSGNVQAIASSSSGARGSRMVISKGSITSNNSNNSNNGNSTRTPMLQVSDSIRTDITEADDSGDVALLASPPVQSNVMKQRDPNYV